MRAYEIIVEGHRATVRDYIPDDSGGEYDVHERTFWSVARAEQYVRTMRKVESEKWKSE